MRQHLGTLAAMTVGTLLSTACLVQAADGAALWDKNCASCHGKDGRGDTKAGKLTKVQDLTAGDVRARLTREHTRTTIEQGIVDTSTGKIRMKGYKDKFSADELDALTSHVISLTTATK